MAAKYSVVMTTVARRADGLKLARQAVARRLAACVQVVPGVVSTYRWEGKTQQSLEYLLLLKTSKKALPGLLKLLKATHPYDLPELIVLPVGGGSRSYLEWVDQETRPTQKGR